MTQIRLYSIRDIKTDSFEPPLASQNDETAKRLFSNIVKSVPTMRNNPEDFNLHSSGTMCTETGLLYPAVSLQFICSGLSCVNPTEVNPTEKVTTNETTKVSNDTPIQPSPKS